MSISKCDMCLCAVCNAFKCPYRPKYNRELQLSQYNILACSKRCYIHNKKQPCLQCDYFVHKERIRIFRIVRKERAVFSAKEVAEMLQEIKEELKGDFNNEN